MFDHDIYYDYDIIIKIIIIVKTLIIDKCAEKRNEIKFMMYFIKYLKPYNFFIKVLRYIFIFFIFFALT